MFPPCSGDNSCSGQSERNHKCVKKCYGNTSISYRNDLRYSKIILWCHFFIIILWPLIITINKLCSHYNNIMTFCVQISQTFRLKYITARKMLKIKNYSYTICKNIIFLISSFATVTKHRVNIIKIVYFYNY